MGAGSLAPLAAFFGGYVSQELVKAITLKYIPTRQFFYTDAVELLPQQFRTLVDFTQELIEKYS